jgi:hypothetical protein
VHGVCQKSDIHRSLLSELFALNHGVTRRAVGLYWVRGHAGVRGNEIADKLTRDGSVQWFVGPEAFLGVSRQNIRRKMRRWMEKQHLAL